MSKDITRKILSGNFWHDGDSFCTNKSNYTIYLSYIPFSYIGRHWYCKIYINYYDSRFLIANVDIQTIDHFNKLMDLMDIDFRIKEE